MSKDLFMMMREKEIATSNFLPTKKEIISTCENFAKKLVDDGEYNTQELHAQAIRSKEAFTAIESTLRKYLPDENFEGYGIKGTFRNGGDAINYDEDEVYRALKKDLEDRVELLKLAQKQLVIDAYGNDVPKVSTTPKKSSLAISF